MPSLHCHLSNFQFPNPESSTQHLASHPLAGVSGLQSSTQHLASQPLAGVSDPHVHEHATRSCRSFARSCPVLCAPMDCSTPGLPIPHRLPGSPRFMPIESVMPCTPLTLCRPSSSCLQSLPASQNFPVSQLCTSGAS